MTIAGPFTVRPLERSSGGSLDQTAFRVHLSAKELKNLGLTAGDRIRLTTAKRFHGFALAWLAQQTNPGNKPIAKVADLLREKYELALTDALFIERVQEAPRFAASMELVFPPSSEALKKYATKEELEHFAKVALEDLEILTPGCTFDVEKKPKSLSPGSKLRMAVANVSSDEPDEQRPFLFHRTCELVFANEPTTNATVAPTPSPILRFDGTSIGGLAAHITTIDKKLREISSPSFPRADSIHQRPTTFLLHGPEGCGKSLVLKRLSEASWRKVYRLDEAWLTENRKGQSQALSEDIFAAARKNQPSLILIDNLDRFVQKAECLVDQMQEELEKLQNTKVVVAAAARTIYDIDARLRSQRGLAIELEVYPPNVIQREDILRHLVGPKIKHCNIDWAHLAEKCHGFVGRDMDNLLKLARAHCTDRILDSLGENAEDTINEVLEKADFVTQEDFDAVIGQIQPSVLKDSVIEVPKINWEDIAGVDHVRSLLESIVVRPYKFPELDSKFGAPQSRKGILLYGPPGCAKTLIAQAVATESNQNFLAVKGSELIKMYVGESERAIRDVFRRARAAKPCIIFFDEIDSIGKSRDKGQDSGLNVVTTLLNEMDGIEALKDVFIIGATNRPDILDSALIRVGRFDVHIHIGLPTKEARRRILEIHTRKWPLADDVDLDDLASKTEGSSGADIKGLCGEVVEFAKTDYLLQGSNGEAKVCKSHFERGLAEHTPRTLAEEAARYEGWRPGRSLAME